MQKALVAGGAGFIGSHLCRSLLKDGYEVICVDNLITGDKNNIKELLKNPQFKFIEHDITNPVQSSTHSTRFAKASARRASSGLMLSEVEASKFKVQRLDYVFHLASPASPNKKSRYSYINHPIETLLANSVGTYNLLIMAKKHNAKFLYASSSEIYGDPKISPQNEKYFGNVNPVGIRSSYDEGKRFGEALTSAFIRKHKVEACIVRIFNTYGPNMQEDDGRVVSNFITAATVNKPITVYGDGSQTRSFCYIDDMINGLKRALFLEKAQNEVINLGNPNELTILELANLIKRMTNTSLDIVFEKLPEDDPKQRKPDIAKAKRLLGWEPKVAIAEGLEKTIKYFKGVIKI